jgi:hypothetical protein
VPSKKPQLTRSARRHLPVPARRALGRLRSWLRPRAEAPAKPARTRAAATREQPAGAKAPAPPREALLRAVERGRPLDQAALTQVRALVRSGRHGAAHSVAESLRRQEDTRALGHLAGGIVAFRQGYLELARQHFSSVPRALWATRATAEYVQAGLSVAREATLAEIGELVAEDPPALTARNWFDVLGPVFGVGAQSLAREVFGRFDRSVEENPGKWRDARMHRDWMRPWVEADPGSPTAPGPGDGRPTFGIIDYGHPGAKRASANIGDHIQSIASLGHLVRHERVRLHGPPALVDMLGTLRARTRPQRRRTDVEGDLDVLTVHRDASMYQAIPEGTWVLCFGWYMHALFSMRHGFPLHRNLRPIFISMHCNKRELLTPDAIAYLKRYGPVGCRDWTTVYLLGSIGVPAFFSGCLTTTIDTVFPERDAVPGPEAPTAYVDALPSDVPAGAVTYKHSSDKVRHRSFVENVRIALERLDTYRRLHPRVVTSRLHCYLPLRGLGMDVDFHPKNASDPRFDGLIGIDDAAFGAIRDGISDKLEQVYARILAGGSEAEVYELWRRITADDVAAAERRRQEESAITAVAADGGGRPGAAAGVAAPAESPAPVPGDSTVHCAVVVSKGAGRSLTALVASLREGTSRPLHLWLLTRPGAGPVRQQLAESFPDVTFSRVRIGKRAGEPGEPPPGTPTSPELVPLTLGEILPDVDRVILLPLPAVVTTDIGELADLDLGGHPLAAPTVARAKSVSGFGVINVAASRLNARTELANELRRTAYARHRFDFDAFSADVLVLDLARARRERLAERGPALVEAFDMSGLEVLHYLLGPGRAEVPARWARVPTRTPDQGPGLIHWADAVKPWQPELTPERQLWRRFAASVPAATTARGGAA